MATAVVLGETHYAGAFVVEDLSAGGALLIGDPRLEPHEHVKILLQIQGRRPINLSAEVIRHEVRASGDHLFAVAFRHLRPAVEDMIHSVVLSALERARSSPEVSVLVVDGSPDIRHALERDLHALGVGMVAAATPLEAVQRVEDPQAKIDLAFVDLSLGQTDGSDFLAWLADEHPGIHRVLMSGDVRLCQLELARSSGRADDVLPKPWEQLMLADILRHS